MAKTKKTKRSVPKTKGKKPPLKDEDETQELDHDSTTPDPTQPDSETSHVKKHKIGFDYKNKNK
jgi:hypothetical protein